MSCPTHYEISNTLFSNVCLFTGVSNNLPVISALKTCCGAANVITTSDGCVTYCNITAPWDEENFSICVFDNLDSSIIPTLDGGCRDHFDPDEDDFPPPAIATTWTMMPKTLTMSAGGSAIKTVTIGTASPTFSLGTPTPASSPAVSSTSSAAGSSPAVSPPTGTGTTTCSTTLVSSKASSAVSLSTTVGQPSVKPSVSGNSTASAKPSPTPVPSKLPVAAASDVRISKFGVGAMAFLVLAGLML